MEVSTLERSEIRTKKRNVMGDFMVQAEPNLMMRQDFKVSSLLAGLMSEKEESRRDGRIKEK